MRSVLLSYYRDTSEEFANPRLFTQHKIRMTMKQINSILLLLLLLFSLTRTVSTTGERVKGVRRNEQSSSLDMMMMKQYLRRRVPPFAAPAATNRGRVRLPHGKWAHKDKVFRQERRRQPSISAPKDHKVEPKSNKSITYIDMCCVANGSLVGTIVHGTTIDLDLNRNCLATTEKKILLSRMVVAV